MHARVQADRAVLGGDGGSLRSILPVSLQGGALQHAGTACGNQQPLPACCCCSGNGAASGCSMPHLQLLGVSAGQSLQAWASLAMASAPLRQESTLMHCRMQEVKETTIFTMEQDSQALAACFNEVCRQDKVALGLQNSCVITALPAHAGSEHAVSELQHMKPLTGGSLPLSNQLA